MLCHLNWDSQEAIFLLESWVQSSVDMIRPSSSVFRTECESSRTLLVRTQTLSRTSSGWPVPTEVRGSFILQLFTVIKINIENQICIFPVDGIYFNQKRQNLFIRNHDIISSIHPQTTEVCFPIYRTYFKGFLSVMCNFSCRLFFRDSCNGCHQSPCSGETCLLLVSVILGCSVFSKLLSKHTV